MNSIRRRLLVGTAAATIAIFLAAAGALYVLARHFLIAEFDATLRSRIQGIASYTEFDPLLQRVEFDADDAARVADFQPGPNPEYFEVATGDGQELARSASLGARQIDRSRLVGRSSPAAAFVVLPDGRAGRAMMFRARTATDEESGAVGPDLSFTVAKSTAPLDRQLAWLRLLLLVVCGVATPVLLGLMGWIIR